MFLPYSLTGMRLFDNPSTIEADETTPYVNLSYAFTDNISVFGTYSEGFKTGGVTQRIADVLDGLAPDAQLPGFKPEFVNAYEIGLKSILAGNTLRLNAAVFFNEYEDLQVQVLQPGKVSVINDNAAEAEVLGAEADFEWLATDAFKINGGVGWMDGEYTRLEPEAQAFGITLDSKLVNTPEWTTYLSASYEIPVGAWFLTPRVDWSYSSEMFKDTRNTQLIKLDDLHLLNAALRLANRDQSWVLTLRGDNLTDETYLLSGGNFADFGVIDAMYDRGIQWRFTVDYRYR